MSVIPRYLPATVSPRREALIPSADARAAALAALVGGGRWNDYAFDTLRLGLFAYFASLALRPTVLMSAQICPVVPLAARAAGLQPRFVDIDECGATPGPERFLAAMDAQVGAVVVAPIYGHLDGDWSEFGERLGGAKLVLDLAQGLALGDRVHALLERADAVGISFGLGKGLDCGGGLLLTRDPLAGAAAPRGNVGHGTAFQSLALSLLVRSGLYRTVAGALGESPTRANFPAPSSALARRRAPNYAVWRSGAEEFAGAVAEARMRAGRLARELPTQHLACAQWCFNQHAAHLRQIIRVQSPEQRQVLLRALLRDGIDCAPAGERLPQEYLDTPSNDDFPNARRLRGEAIRLPFLGRLAEPEFRRVAIALKRGLAELRG